MLRNYSRAEPNRPGAKRIERQHAIFIIFIRIRNEREEHGSHPKSVDEQLRPHPVTESAPQSSRETLFKVSAWARSEGNRQDADSTLNNTNVSIIGWPASIVSANQNEDFKIVANSFGVR